MRIISKYKDYYDGVQVYGTDSSNIYKRDIEEIDKKQPIYNSILKFSETIKKNIAVYKYYRSTFGAFELGLVLFCGKVIPYVIFEHQIMNKYVLETKYYITYNMQDVDDIINKLLNKDEQKEFNKTSKYFFMHSLTSRKTILSIFEHSFKEYDAIKDMLLDAKCPVILVSYKYKNNSPTIIKNPVLKDIEFYRVMDSYTTFQEIARYVDGILIKPAVETIEVSDKIKRDKHGFDKWSFKKMPKEN